MPNPLSFRAEFPDQDCYCGDDSCWWLVWEGMDFHRMTKSCDGWTIPKSWEGQTISVAVARPCAEDGYYTPWSGWVTTFPVPEPSGFLWVGLVGLALLGRGKK